MVTGFHVGTNRPTQHLTSQVSSLPPLPKNYRDAFHDPNWKNAMCDEYSALIKNKTWILVPRPTDTNIVLCMWLFRHKCLADGTLSRYKARLVENGNTQIEGVDVDGTFSLAGMVSCNFSRTRVYTDSKLGDDVQQVCLHMHDSREPHLSALKRILRYVRGTLDFGLQLYSSSTTDLVAYSDADWAGCPTT
uniref:Ribonuclease H-like domain-containing protein n=1 Tax=Tanacetum cinerariifolium TaxID=118510 RepID=A0A699JZJ7_TANCI|nr:ribonuclease H-like domain-containing protein [Tanacetum cinerariifolium]